MYEQMNEEEKVEKGSGTFVSKIPLFALIFLAASLCALVFSVSQGSQQIRAFHATDADVNWFVVGNGYCRTECNGACVDFVYSQAEKYACAATEEECQTTCGNDPDCLGYAFASDPSPESESDAFNKQDTNCKAAGLGRCIFYEDDAGFEVEISETTEDRQEYTCSCKAEEDGTCEGAPLHEVRNKFLTYLLGSFGLLGGLFFVAASCLKCCKDDKSKKKSIALMHPDVDDSNRKSIKI